MGEAPDLTSFGDHGMIQALERHQILVCASLFDFAVLDDQNFHGNPPLLFLYHYNRERT